MEEKKGNGRQKGAIATAGLLILSKLKWVLVTLKVFKFGTTLISLILSLVTYAIIFGWEFAVALIYVLFIHEMGHLVAAKIKGIPTTPAVFVPFMGAVIGMKERPKDAETEAFVAYGGPLFGLFSTVPPLLLFQVTHQPIWGVTLLVAALLNLFNLIPISPLDGGRIIGVLSPHIWLLGLIGLTVFTYFFTSPILVIILILGVFSWWRRVRETFNISRFSIEIESWQKMKAELNQNWDDLFYQSYTNGEERLVNDVMRMHLIREWENKSKRALSMAQNQQNGFKIPILHDKQKLEHYRSRVEAAMYTQLMDWVQTVQAFHEREAILREMDRQIQRLDGERRAINQYYNATVKTKWVTFGLYILLAAALGLLYIHAQTLVPANSL